MTVYFVGNIIDNSVFVYNADGGAFIASLPTSSFANSSSSGVRILPLGLTQPAPSYLWTDIDFSLCLPLPAAYATTTEKAEAMAGFFTGSATTAPLALCSLQTQGNASVSVVAGATTYASLSGYFGQFATMALSNSILGACTIKEILFYVSANTATTTTTFSLMVNEVAVETMTVATTVVGVQTFGTLSTPIAATDRVCLAQTTVSGAGAISVGGLTTFFTPTT